MEKLYTRKEAAAFLGISMTSLDEARYAQAITYVQYVPGGNVFFTEESLQAYIARGTHQAIPVAAAVRRPTYRKPWKKLKSS